MTNIYVISLARSQERRKQVTQEMAAQNICFEFFDAIDGHQAMHWLADDYDYVHRLWFTSGKMPTKGELGCYASHYSLWLKCIELNRPIIVCEDDIELSQNAANIAEYALANVKKYGFLRLESIEPDWVYHSLPASDNFTFNLLRDNYGGTRAYAIAPQAAARLIKHRWCLPVDCFIGATYIHGQFSYQLIPCFVSDHGNYQSTIQINEGECTAIYRKLTRELYTIYKKIRLTKNFKNKITQHQANIER